MVEAHVNMGMLERVPGDNHQFVGNHRFAFIMGDQLTELRMHPVKAHIKKA